MAGFANDVVFANNGDFSIAGSNKGQIANGLLTNGQMWIGTTSTNAGGTHINVGSLTSPDSSITISYSSPNITLVANASGGLLHTLTGNSGVATASAGNINVVTANSTPIFSGSGSTITQDFGLANLILGSAPSAITSAENCVGLGQNALLSITSAQNCIGIGNSSLGSNTSGSNNIGIGSATLDITTNSSDNVAIGFDCLSSLTSSVGQNVSVGTQALGTINTGRTNIGLGYGAGGQYNGSESSNIIIGNIGVRGESNVIRIGTTGSSAGQQNKAFLAGVTGVTVTGSAPVGVDTNGQMSSLGFGTATQVLTSNGAGVSPTWQAAGGSISPIFQAFLSANQSNVTGDGTNYTIPFNSVSTNTGSAYNTGTSTFTAPSTGTYLFTGTVYLVEGGSFSGMTQSNITLVATVATFTIYTVNPATMNGNAALVVPFSSIIPMTAGDTAQLKVQVGTTTKTVLVGGTQGLSAFAGFKIG
jgi:C1q domain